MLPKKELLSNVDGPANRAFTSAIPVVDHVGVDQFSDVRIGAPAGARNADREPP